MKFLKIENNKGYFLISKNNPTEFVEIDRINKENLLELLNSAITEDFEMDIFDEAILANKAHQIIYKNIFEKFTDLISMKSRFKDESESTYKEAIDKYNINGDEE